MPKKKRKARFKKGSAAAKAWGRKMRRLRKSPSGRKRISKSHSVTKSKRKRRKNPKTNMVKRRRARRRAPVRRRVRRRAARLDTGILMRAALGAGGYVLYETFLSPKIPVSGFAKNAVELAGGLFLSRRAGVLGAVGRTAVVLNSYQILRSLMGGLAAPAGKPANGNGLDIA